ncbi:MAG: type II toxin-antitoxin system VapC family toxin [Actinomycetota bacterium]|nr:type II toxin-antitoxin system VapC family toxin [Actinomycetota bacterium]
MTLVYFDASALVKLVVEEDGSDLVAALWDGCDSALSSRLSYPEVRSALAAAARDHRIATSSLRMAVRDWERFWSAVQPVELTAAVERHAGELTGTYSLRGADAIHLASAMAIELPDLIVAVWDHRLREGVLSAGLRVAPA